MKLALSFPGALVLLFALGGCTERVKEPVSTGPGADTGGVIVCAPGSFTSGNECIPVKAAECPSGTTARGGQCVADADVDVTVAELKAAADKPAGNSGEYDDVLDPRKIRRQPRARQLLVTEIQGLESLFASMPKDASDRPVLMRRLAEGYVELSAAAARDGAETMDAQVAGKAKKIESASHMAAIKYYTLVVDQYPTFCRATTVAGQLGCNDDTLYYLALEHLRTAQLDSARRVLLRLIQGWPKSDKIGPAYFLFGEMFRNESAGDPSKWAFAEQSYREAAKYSGPIQMPSLARLADVYEKQGKTAEAAAIRKKIDGAKSAAPDTGP